MQNESAIASRIIEILHARAQCRAEPGARSTILERRALLPQGTLHMRARLGAELRGRPMRKTWETAVSTRRSTKERDSQQRRVQRRAHSTPDHDLSLSCEDAPKCSKRMDQQQIRGHQKSHKTWSGQAPGRRRNSHNFELAACFSGKASEAELEFTISNFSTRRGAEAVDCPGSGAS